MPGLDQLMLSGTSTWLKGYRFPEGLLGSAHIDGPGQVQRGCHRNFITNSLPRACATLPRVSSRAPPELFSSREIADFVVLIRLASSSCVSF